MNKTRLRQMIRVLETLPKDHVFDLEGWGNPCGCQTVVCACGAATLDPWFNKQGFISVSLYNYLPVYKQDMGWEAVKKFFQLSKKDAQYLFSYASYDNLNDPKPVIYRLKRFLTRKDLTKA